VAIQHQSDLKTTSNRKG